MTPRDALERVLGERFKDGEGRTLLAQVIRSDEPDWIGKSRARLAQESALPGEIEDLLRIGVGLCIGHTEVRWDGNLGGQYLDEVFPWPVPVMEDGFGNSWSVEVDRGTAAWGAVWFLCHDPPVVVYQASSLAEFILQFAAEFRGGREDGPLTRVHEHAAMEVWRQGGAAAAASSLTGTADPVLQRILRGCAPTDGVCDLRRPAVGDGFRWSVEGGDVIVRRPGPEPVFVIDSCGVGPLR